VTLISYLRQKGVKKISEDSSGNAGASIAAYAARAGMEGSSQELIFRYFS